MTHAYIFYYNLHTIHLLDTKPSFEMARCIFFKREREGGMERNGERGGEKWREGEEEREWELSE